MNLFLQVLISKETIYLSLLFFIFVIKSASKINQLHEIYNFAFMLKIFLSNNMSIPNYKLQNIHQYFTLSKSSTFHGGMDV